MISAASHRRARRQGRDVEGQQLETAAGSSGSGRPTRDPRRRRSSAAGQPGFEPVPLGHELQLLPRWRQVEPRRRPAPGGPQRLQGALDRGSAGCPVARRARAVAGGTRRRTRGEAAGPRTTPASDRARRSPRARPPAGTPDCAPRRSRADAGAAGTPRASDEAWQSRRCWCRRPAPPARPPWRGRRGTGTVGPEAGGTCRARSAPVGPG